MPEFKSDAYWHCEVMLLTSEGLQKSDAEEEEGGYPWATTSQM